jgi:hypothetical protein
MSRIVIIRETFYLCTYLGPDSSEVNLRYSEVKPLHADVLLQLIGLVEQTRFQAPEKQTKES